MTPRRTDHTNDATVRGVRATAGDLLPGGVIGDGRYRLLAPFGVDLRGNAHMWRARDGQLRRDVALTVLVGDPTNRDATLAARRTLERAAHAARFMNPTVSRVLDVLGVGGGIDPSEGVLGVVVADWAQGTDLIDLIAEHPLPAGTAARLLEPLAIAVEEAHHTGLVLGVDHPQRVRIGPDGALRLAFPGPLPQASLQDDVKGLGAILYLLLTGRWPLPGGPPTIPQPPRERTGAPVSPALLRQDVPDDLADLAVRSIVDTSLGGIRTSSAFLTVLEGVAQRAELIEQQTQLIDPVVPGEVQLADQDTIWTTNKRPPRDDDRRRKLAIGVTALTVATVGVLAWVGMQLISFFGSDPVPAAVQQSVVAAPPSTSSNPGNEPQANPPPAPKPAAPVKPTKVAVYSVKGDKDNARNVARVTDGKPNTFWATGQYKQPFPALKPGIGVMATFEQATKMASVSIDSPSEGTVVEIRSASSATAKFDDTKVIGTATLTNGKTDIALSNAEPTEFVLVWITKLGVDGNQNVSQIREIEFQSAQ
ncbi:protein kinase family protein [Kibdelosporangium persicum]|uniref:Integral membrane protein MviN n=1 Tax=Kibdelosporangium persicum TaxID=2698649 RepID=A0ABX2EY69_9PSEU|nr:protein kinase family protein [Kibdelosporangium persicum]NRN63964.1 Integral membrane protein MviN [Kibdelosporangium persicum]